MNPCKSGKRSFETEHNALATEKSNREKFNNETQYAYQCEECGAYHLTSLAPGEGRTARVNYAEAGNLITGGGRGRKFVLASSIEAKIHELYAKNVNALAISREVSLPYCTVRRVLGIVPKAREGNSPRVPKNIDSIEQRKADLRRQLEMLDAEEKRFREQNELRVVVEGAVTVIKKGHESLHLFDSDVNDLFEKLMDKLTAGAAA
jgi:hypothetical protein